MDVLTDCVGSVNESLTWPSPRTSFCKPSLWKSLEETSSSKTPQKILGTLNKCTNITPEEVGKKSFPHNRGKGELLLYRLIDFTLRGDLAVCILQTYSQLCTRTIDWVCAQPLLYEPNPMHTCALECSHQRPRVCTAVYAHALWIAFLCVGKQWKWTLSTYSLLSTPHLQ